MAVDRKKLISIFKDECNKIGPSVDGNELFEAVTDIILAEFNHQEKATNIQQKVNDIVDRIASQTN